MRKHHSGCHALTRVGPAFGAGRSIRACHDPRGVETTESSHSTNTAKALGLERSHLYKKCQQLGLDLRARAPANRRALRPYWSPLTWYHCKFSNSRSFSAPCSSYHLRQGFAFEETDASVIPLQRHIYPIPHLRIQVGITREFDQLWDIAHPLSAREDAAIRDVAPGPVAHVLSQRRW